MSLTSSTPSLADHVECEVELLLSTPHTIVVRARLEFAGGAGAQDAGLVIARQHCHGDRPSGQALLDAARQCLRRAGSDARNSARTVQRLLARIDGQWRPLLDRRPAASSSPGD